MPLPTPRDDEKQDAFISRCMGSETAMKDFPEQEQRLAVCFNRFRAAKKEDSSMADDKTEVKTFGLPTETDARRELGPDAPTAAISEWLEVAQRTYRGCVDEGGTEQACTAVSVRAANVEVKPGVELTTDEKRKRDMGTGDKRKDRMMGQSLNNVEIFRTGTWNGDKFNTTDLDDMVNNFNAVGFKPPVKLGHDEKSGDPAFGWVAALRRVGDRLVADFIDLPDKIFQAIKDKQFDAVSSEIFFNLKRDGKLFKRALKAVALLGANIPAVSNLRPLSESLQESLGTFTCEQVTLYTNREDETMPDKKAPDTVDEKQALEQKVAKLEQQLAEASKGNDAILQLQEMKETIAQLQQQTQEAQERERRATIKGKVDECHIPVLRNHLTALYDAATQTTKTVKFSVDGNESELPATKVLDDMVRVLNKTSEKLFKELGTSGGLKRDDHPAEDPSVELDRLTKEYMSKHNEAQYYTAFNKVLSDPDNVDLKKAYAQRT